MTKAVSKIALVQELSSCTPEMLCPIQRLYTRLCVCWQIHGRKQPVGVNICMLQGDCSAAGRVLPSCEDSHIRTPAMFHHEAQGQDRRMWKMLRLATGKWEMCLSLVLWWSQIQ